MSLHAFIVNNALTTGFVYMCVRRAHIVLVLACIQARYFYNNHTYNVCVYATNYVLVEHIYKLVVCVYVGIGFVYVVKLFTIDACIVLFALV